MSEKGTLKIVNNQLVAEPPTIEDGSVIMIKTDEYGLVPLPVGWSEVELIKSLDNLMEHEIEDRMWKYVKNGSGWTTFDLERMKKLLKNDIEIKEILQFCLIANELPLVIVKDVNNKKFGILFSGRHKSIKPWSYIQKLKNLPQMFRRRKNERVID